MKGPAVTERFTVTVDQPQTPRSRKSAASSYPPAGPVAEGAGEGTGTAEPVKGNTARKVFFVVSGLLVLAALICGIGYLVFLRDTGESSSSTSVNNGVLTSESSVAADHGDVEASPGTTAGAEAAPTESGSFAEDTSGGSSANVTAPVSATPPTVSNTTQMVPSPPAANATNVTAPPPVLTPVPVNATLGSYDAPVDLSVIPVAVAVLPSGKVLAWSAETPDDFYREDRYIVGGGGSGKTYHAVWDPVTNEATSLLVANTGHDMFCPGVTMMPNGDIIVTGGQNANRTSIYQLATNTWVAAAEMEISRGYGSSVLLANGKVFVLGGSWSGPSDLKKDAEIYDPTLGTWSLLPGIQADFILTKDPEDAQEGRDYRADNYGMFHSWTDSKVFHAGPSTDMLWFTTDGEGSALKAGVRPGGNIANGNSVMYDKGKILNCGGSEAFALEEYPATAFATLVEIDQPNFQVDVRQLSPMNLPRVYANGVVLPDGKVLITGGASAPKEFSDEFAHYQPEIWDPETEEFALLDAKHVNGRTYHSVAALLPDGRVFTGGGGLCGSGLNGIEVLCEGPVNPNHLDFEIFNPPYLFKADGSLAPRPTIKLSAASAKHGASLTVTSSEQLMMVSMIRMGSATHSTNTDQRRLELCGPFTTPCAVSPVTVTVPEDPGIALSGNWMIFGVNADGVPSVASTLNVGNV